MTSEDPFRYCVYCRADCYEDEPEHADDCPSSTGVYPVDGHFLKPFCPHCGESMHGPPRCMDCDEVIPVGSHYVHRELDPGDPLLPGMAGAAVYTLLCLGCAAKEATE